MPGSPSSSPSIPPRRRTICAAAGFSISEAPISRTASTSSSSAVRKVGLVLVGREDNLGKGASGNAVQCLNLMLGVDETTGLTA